MELKQLAYQFALKIDVEYPRSWDENEMVGTGLCCATKNWSLRTPEQTSLNPVKMFTTFFAIWIPC